MSAPAGAATAAHEGQTAAVRGEDARGQAAIVIVCREPGAREILHRELSRRYGADYQILVCDRPAELAAWVRDLRTAGTAVALVIAGVGPQDPDGIEVLAPVLHPRSDPVTARSGREPDARAVRSWPKSRIAAAVPCADGAGPRKRGHAATVKSGT